MSKHTILFLAANPVGTSELALGREARAIQAELERTGFRSSFEFVTRWAAEPLDLLRELRALTPTVVHFSGHGIRNGDGARGSAAGPHRDVIEPGVVELGVADGGPDHGLMFQDADGQLRLVSTTALQDAFDAAGSSVRLVVLSACYSESQAAALRSRVDCVVGMRGSIGDDAARSFAIGFYGGLGDRASVAAAYKQGCAAIRLQGLADGDKPQLVVRDGVAAGAVVLADLASSNSPGRPRGLVPPPTPAYADAEVEALSKQLERARQRKHNLRNAGIATDEVDREILGLRRQLREGGQLRAGDALGDGRYLLVKPVGRGGFAVVWEAFDRTEQRNVAIKVLHQHLAGESQRRERFFRGARVMMDLKHPIVVRVLDPRGEDESFCYFVMELVPGGNLREAVLAQRVKRDSVVPLILQVGVALAEAHRKPLIHRDIKPANILLDEHGNAKLTDFDLVGAHDTTGGTRTGALGTVVYAAPECLDKPQDATARADVYGLGMTAIFGLVGRELSLSTFRNPEPTIAGLDCPALVKDVLRRAVAWESEQRYADAGEMVASLKNAQERPAWAVDSGRDGCGLWAEFIVKGVRHRMRWIPPGTFLMGSPPSEVGRSKDEGPQHEVKLTRGYWLGETPVTQGLWEAVMGENPSLFVSGKRPVEQVSWDDCQQFIDRLNYKLDGLEARLPTEAEWECACRARTTTATWVGDLTLRDDHDAPELDAIAWYGGNSGVDFELEHGVNSSDWPGKQHPHTRAGTHPVGRKAPNPYGLHDMLGNVYEWCQDAADPDALPVYAPEAATDRVSRAKGQHRVFRGGAWLSEATSVRAAYRAATHCGNCYRHVGFRLAGGPASAPSEPSSPDRESRSDDQGRGAGPDGSRASERDKTAAALDWLPRASPAALAPPAPRLPWPVAEAFDAARTLDELVGGTESTRGTAPPVAAGAAAEPVLTWGGEPAWGGEPVPVVVPQDTQSRDPVVTVPMQHEHILHERAEDIAATTATVAPVTERPSSPPSAPAASHPDGDELMVTSNLDERPVWAVDERPVWAVASGIDDYGLWAAFDVGGVRHRMRWIPPGTFVMGSPLLEMGRRGNEGPQHEVTLTRGYWLGETPVTQALWVAVMGENPSRFRGELPDDLERPMEQVSWEDCQRFLDVLNAQVGGLGARLPTEAEWERSCSAGTTTAIWVGELSDEKKAPGLDAIAWYGNNSGGETHPVGRKAPNPYGLYDMLGNVWEWCADDMRAYTAAPVTDPAGDEQVWYRVYRGGSWDVVARYVRAAYRDANPRDYRIDDLGFRLAGDAEPRVAAEVERARAEAEARAAVEAERARAEADARAKEKAEARVMAEAERVPAQADAQVNRSAGSCANEEAEAQEAQGKPKTKRPPLDLARYETWLNETPPSPFFEALRRIAIAVLAIGLVWAMSRGCR